MYSICHEQSLQKEKEKLQNTVQKQQEKITELKREATLFGKRTDLEWKKLEANQKVNIICVCISFCCTAFL